VAETLRNGVAMDTLVSLSKRRGFVYPGSEMYGGLANTWDFGPLGVELRNNIKQLWWRTFVHQRPDIVGMDGSILLNPRVWEVSGHVGEFNDPLVDCRNCRSRYRADHLIEEVAGRDAEGLALAEMDAIIQSLACPNCGAHDWTPVRAFNMMFRTHIGPVDETSTPVYLRPETAQSIFMQYKNILQSSRLKLPFGIAQIGKAFRNEVTPGNFIFRVLELEQMEIEYFIDPDEPWEPIFDAWLADQRAFIERLGVRPENLRAREHAKEQLSHYSAKTVDLEYRFPFGWSELSGLAYRTDYDLRMHQEGAGENLTFFDQATNRRFIPHVIEPTVGVERLTLVTLLDAYDEEETLDAKGEAASRVVLRFRPEVAPFKAAVLPLSKKPELTGPAMELYQELLRHFVVDYDETQAIGRRYRRQDEIGTPFCVTLDFDSLDDRAVTIRERDSMEQVRVPLAEVADVLRERLGL
jgi:glycyl-tRNA synthetase